MTAPHLEIGTDDFAATRASFGAVFGRSSRDMPKGALFETPEGPIGVHGDDPDGGVVPYFAVADMAAAIARVGAAGGRVEGDATAEAAYVACRDPRGTRFGLYTG